MASWNCRLVVQLVQRFQLVPWILPPLPLPLQALAQALQSHIQVFSVGLPVLELGEEFKSERGGQSVVLCSTLLLSALQHSKPRMGGRAR